MKKKKILDLGCGRNKIKGAIGFDKVPLPEVDVVGDLLDPLPFTDNEFDVIYLNNVLEHFDDIVPIMKEVHRICKPSGHVLIAVPYYNAPTAFHDPTHKKYFTWHSFDYFSPESPWNYYFGFSFKVIRKELIPTGIGRFIPKKFLTRLSHYIPNLVNFLYVVLQPVK